MGSLNTVKLGTYVHACSKQAADDVPIVQISGTAVIGGRVSEPCDDFAGSGKNAACHCFDGLSSDAILEAKRSK